MSHYYVPFFTQNSPTPIWFNIGSGNGLLPEGTKPLPEPMLTSHHWGPVTITSGQIHKRYLSHQSPKLSGKALSKKLHSSSPKADVLNIIAVIINATWRIGITKLCFRYELSRHHCYGMQTCGVKQMKYLHMLVSDQWLILKWKDLEMISEFMENCITWNSHTQSLISCGMNSKNTLRLTQKVHHFADNIFQCIFLNENVWILLKISLKVIPKVPINNFPTFIQMMAWHQASNKPLSEPMMLSLLTHMRHLVSVS